jgi:hypothetical protein
MSFRTIFGWACGGFLLFGPALAGELKAHFTIGNAAGTVAGTGQCPCYTRGRGRPRIGTLLYVQDGGTRFDMQITKGPQRSARVRLWLLNASARPPSRRLQVPYPRQPRRPSVQLRVCFRRRCEARRSVLTGMLLATLIPCSATIARRVSNQQLVSLGCVTKGT